MLEQERNVLEAMAFVEAVSARLGTTSYIWGGFSLDIYEGQFLREHNDIDYLTLNLLPLRPQFIEAFKQTDWQVKVVINEDVTARKNGVKLHLGNVRLGNQVTWTHNGEEGVLTFPLDWLSKEAHKFCGVKVHVVEPHFEYVVKHYPALLNPNWVPRDKDLAARQKLSEILLGKTIDINDLRRHVSDKRGIP